MSELGKLMEYLRDILPNKHVDEADPILCLRSCIERYLNRLDDNADLANSLQEKETHEAYVLCCLHLFNSLTHLDASKDNISPLFSVCQSQQITQCFEFVVCLGIYPLLSPGVSMPLELRLDNFDKFKCPSSNNHEVRIQILSQISDCFDCLLNSPIDTLKDLLSLNKFLGDYLAVLLQLGFGPYSKELLSSKSTLDVIRKSRMRLLNILDRLPRYLSFKQLFLFQSGFTKKQSPAKRVRAPKWLCDACGRLITRLFIARPQSTSGQSALKDLIVGVVDVHSTDPRHIPAVASSLAHILATPPQASSLDEYYSSLSSQIVDILATCRTKSVDSKDVLPQITRLVAVDAIHAICERDLELGKRLFLSELISKLNKIVSTDESNDIEIPSGVIDISDVKEVLSAEDLFSVTDFISELLDTRHPSQALCGLLARYSQIWFRFCSLLKLAYPSGIEEKVEEECQIKEKSGPSPVDEFRSKLLSILSSHLLNPETSFRLIRGWIHLPAIDHSTLKSLSSSEMNSLLFPVPGLIILRPASLVIPNSPESSVPQAPFRVTRIAEPISDHSLEMISAKISTLMELLAPRVNESIVGDKSEEIDEEQKSEEKAERLLNTWTKGNQDEDSEKRANLAAKLLLSLISDINAGVMGDINEENLNIQIGIQPTNFDNERAHQDLSISLTACFLASSMLERLDPSILWPSEPALAAQLMSLTLSRLCAVIDIVTEKEILKMTEESLNLVLGILAFFVNYMEKGDKVSSEARNHFGELVPLLQRVESIFPETSASAELAQQIRIALCTRGAFSIPPPQNSNPAASPKKRLIEELSSTTSADDHPVAPSKPKSEIPPQLTEIFNLLSDPFIPVKGHALIELSRLLESKDSCIIGFESEIYKTLVEYTNHEDSYIYLNAIRGLSAIGNACTDRLLPFLLERFVNKSDIVEFRLKIGEAIVRVLRELGEIAPKYRDAVVAGLLTASKDDSEFIRAASLSNLAEICQLLGESIQSVIYEIYNVMEHCLKHDVSALVRKSAAYLAGGLFRSGPATSRRDQLARLPAEIVRDTHRLLRDRSMIEKDEMVLEQLETAMFEVDACAREVAFCPPDKPGDLIKEIRVLRPFDQ
ncbi:unnamed protein product [Hymenolepis diminuta]|uniref:RTP1_C1 domain-containing protein n=1 Tax=Hymenolepis diminuta TaxID=6216 RepID=A0A0R3S8Y1_HYMDI|nr:unnamed protein product [Hymenolepis diminuta]